MKTGAEGWLLAAVGSAAILEAISYILKSGCRISSEGRRLFWAMAGPTLARFGLLGMFAWISFRRDSPAIFLVFAASTLLFLTAGTWLLYRRRAHG